MSEGRLIAVGEIGRPHGLHGEVRVTPLTDRPDRFRTLHDCVLWDADHDRREPCRIRAVRWQGVVLLVSLAGRDTPEAVADLRGRLLAVPESEVIPAPPGYFYPWQLEGARVITEDGRVLGRMLRVESGTAQDLWVIGDGGREYLVPAVPEIVREVDLAGRRVVVRPPEGLLEL